MLNGTDPSYSELITCIFLLLLYVCTQDAIINEDGSISVRDPSGHQLRLVSQ